MSCNLEKTTKDAPKSMRYHGLFIIPAVVLLVGCAQSRKPVAPGSALPTGESVSRPAGSLDNTAGPADLGRGTGDTGGGNGVDGKMFESFIVDITKTPEWEKYLAPIDAKLKEITKNEEPSLLFAEMTRLRTWYIVPMKLSEIPREKLGIDVTRDPIQQFALQNRNAVWIDRDLYNKMDPRDRALLLLHEMVMAYYLTKFEDMEITCRRVSSKPDCGIGEESREMFAEYAKPEPNRPLTADDYDQIRAMTAWIMDNYPSWKSEADLGQQFLARAFDSRFPIGGDEKEKDSFTRDEVINTLKAAQTLGRFPVHCEFTAAGKATATCQMRFTHTPNAGWNLEYSLTITPKDNSPARVITGTASVGETEELWKDMPLFTRAAKAKMLFFVSTPKFNGVGEVYHFLNIYLTGDKETPTVAAVVLNPNMITKLTAICRGSQPSYDAKSATPNRKQYPPIMIFENDTLPQAPLIHNNGSPSHEAPGPVYEFKTVKECTDWADAENAKAAK